MLFGNARKWKLCGMHRASPNSLILPLPLTFVICLIIYCRCMMIFGKRSLQYRLSVFGIEEMHFPLDVRRNQ